MTSRRVAVIPARWASVRFPGKPLALLAGRPMIVHVLERARESGVFDSVWVATDDERIAAAVRQAGGVARMTRADHATGTERVAEATADLAPDAIVVNVQGDEPLVAPALLRDLVELLESHPEVDIVTAAHEARDPAGRASPHVVKVVRSLTGDALYFSRAAIPHSRDDDSAYLHHIGIYGFRRAALARFAQLAPSALERREGLEQLRGLENGMRVRVLLTTHASRGVDTPEDLKAVALRLLGA